MHEREMPIAAAAATATDKKHSLGHSLLIPSFAYAECSDRPRPLPSQAFASAIA